jgi:hypothetical protein
MVRGTSLNKYDPSKKRTDYQLINEAWKVYNDVGKKLSLLHTILPKFKAVFILDPGLKQECDAKPIRLVYNACNGENPFFFAADSFLRAAAKDDCIEHGGPPDLRVLDYQTLFNDPTNLPAKSSGTNEVCTRQTVDHLNHAEYMKQYVPYMLNPNEKPVPKIPLPETEEQKLKREKKEIKRETQGKLRKGKNAGKAVLHEPLQDYPKLKPLVSSQEIQEFVSKGTLFIKKRVEELNVLSQVKKQAKEKQEASKSLVLFSKDGKDEEKKTKKQGKRNKMDSSSSSSTSIILPIDLNVVVSNNDPVGYEPLVLPQMNSLPFSLKANGLQEDPFFENSNVITNTYVIHGEMNNNNNNNLIEEVNPVESKESEQVMMQFVDLFGKYFQEEKPKENVLPEENKKKNEEEKKTTKKRKRSEEKTIKNKENELENSQKKKKTVEEELPSFTYDFIKPDTINIDTFIVNNAKQKWATLQITEADGFKRFLTLDAKNFGSEGQKVELHSFTVLTENKQPKQPSFDFGDAKCKWANSN